MNKILPLPTISRYLAEAAGITIDDANRFIKAFFDTASEALASGEKLTIKGLGTFEPGGNIERPVKFTIDQALHKSVNSPFDAFESIEISGDFDLSELSDLAKTTESESPIPQTIAKIVSVEEPQPQIAEPEPQPESESAAPIVESVPPSEVAEPETEPSAEEPTEEIPAEQPELPQVEEPQEEPEVPSEQDVTESEAPKSSEPVESNEPEMVVTEQPEEKAENAEEVEEPIDDVQPTKEPKSGSKLKIGLALFFGLILGGAAGYFAHDPINGYLDNMSKESHNDEISIDETDSVTQNVAEPVATIDTVATQIDTISAESAQTEVKDDMASRLKNNEVYDTVTRKRYLTTLAGKYYGEKDYWVYIYEANSSKLKHPDKIKPGTRVLIPDISAKLTGDKAQDKANAHHKAGEIYSRYK